MQTQFTSPVKGNNKGSSARIVNYLEKENDLKEGSEKEYFFSANRSECNMWEVIQQIDENAKGQGLKKEHDRFHSIIIAPSQSELAHIGSDPQKLREFTRNVMENYAANFNRGIESKDLVWYAKIENERKYAYNSLEVKAQIKEEGDLKEGDQRHIHIIVSRCAARENSHVLQNERQLTDADRTMQLSPGTNHKGAGAGAVQSGFNRSDFFRANEQAFDKQFGYERSLQESYDYCNAMRKGNKEEIDHAINAHKGLQATKGRELDQSINKAAGLSTGL